MKAVGRKIRILRTTKAENKTRETKKKKKDKLETREREGRREESVTPKDDGKIAIGGINQGVTGNVVSETPDVDAPQVFPTFSLRTHPHASTTMVHFSTSSCSSFPLVSCSPAAAPSPCHASFAVSPSPPLPPRSTCRLRPFLDQPPSSSSPPSPPPPVVKLALTLAYVAVDCLLSRKNVVRPETPIVGLGSCRARRSYLTWGSREEPEDGP